MDSTVVGERRKIGHSYSVAQPNARRSVTISDRLIEAPSFDRLMSSREQPFHYSPSLMLTSAARMFGKKYVDSKRALNGGPSMHRPCLPISCSGALESEGLRF